MKEYFETREEAGDVFAEAESKERHGSWFTVFGDVDDFIFYRGEEADEYRSAR